MLLCERERERRERRTFPAHGPEPAGCTHAAASIQQLWRPIDAAICAASACNSSSPSVAPGATRTADGAPRADPRRGQHLAPVGRNTIAPVAAPPHPRRRARSRRRDEHAGAVGRGAGGARTARARSTRAFVVGRRLEDRAPRARPRSAGPAARRGAQARSGDVHLRLRRQRVEPRSAPGTPLPRGGNRHVATRMARPTLCCRARRAGRRPRAARRAGARSRATCRRARRGSGARSRPRPATRPRRSCRRRDPHHQHDLAPPRPAVAVAVAVAAAAPTRARGRARRKSARSAGPAPPRRAAAARPPAAARCLSGRRAPGRRSCPLPRSSARIHASARSAAPPSPARRRDRRQRRIAPQPRRTRPAQRRVLRHLIPRSTQRSTAPPRSARRRTGRTRLHRRDRRELQRLIELRARRSTRRRPRPARVEQPRERAPRSSSRGTRGSGACTRYRSIARPPSASRLASQSAPSAALARRHASRPRVAASPW